MIHMYITCYIYIAYTYLKIWLQVYNAPLVCEAVLASGPGRCVRSDEDVHHECVRCCDDVKGAQRL
jgi:hypothetical protein